MPLILTSNKTSAEKLPSAAQPKNRTNRQKAPIQHLNPGIPRRFAIYPNPNCLRYFLSPPLARVENAQPIPRTRLWSDPPRPKAPFYKVCEGIAFPCFFPLFLLSRLSVNASARSLARKCKKAMVREIQMYTRVFLVAYPIDRSEGLVVRGRSKRQVR
ncbi:uncharacterized protein K441DRAFT_277659 [Cenococcum geophilum 1.58]|uniref:uncharacterized protein n=1 Tax=Cenococcum geophilum 1.58 TaxID=794803 RepID=UPI00358E5A07|nr:hypothetical protein K441DRAFT_277659 [Cenococcum geophilum 1.58]